MLQLDVLSSFALCGAGALVGVGLLQPVALEFPLPLWSQALMAYVSIGGLIMIGWALAAIAGGRPSRPTMWFTLAAVFAVVRAALPAGTRGMTVVCALGWVAGASLAPWLGRCLIRRPRDVDERLIGVTILLMRLTSALRASDLLMWSAPFESHLMHVPPMMVTPFALLYGVLPVVFATLLHDVINARRLARLHRRAMTNHLTGSLSRHALADGASTLTALTRQGSGRLAVIMA
jgi:hypothetical protein